MLFRNRGWVGSGVKQGLAGFFGRRGKACDEGAGADSPHGFEMPVQVALIGIAGGSRDIGYAKTAMRFARRRRM